MIIALWIIGGCVVWFCGYWLAVFCAYLLTEADGRDVESLWPTYFLFWPFVIVWALCIALFQGQSVSGTAIGAAKRLAQYGERRKELTRQREQAKEQGEEASYPIPHNLADSLVEKQLPYRGRYVGESLEDWYFRTGRADVKEVTKAQRRTP